MSPKLSRPRHEEVPLLALSAYLADMREDSQLLPATNELVWSLGSLLLLLGLIALAVWLLRSRRR